jgi:hypothetical protein
MASMSRCKEGHPGMCSPKAIAHRSVRPPRRDCCFTGRCPEPPHLSCPVSSAFDYHPFPPIPCLGRAVRRALVEPWHGILLLDLHMRNCKICLQQVLCPRFSINWGSLPIQIDLEDKGHQKYRNVYLTSVQRQDKLRNLLKRKNYKIEGDDYSCPLQLKYWRIYISPHLPVSLQHTEC